MIERLGRRLISSILVWDVVLTLIVLSSTSVLRLELDYGNFLTEQQAQIPLPVYGVVAITWMVVFWILAPQRALFFGDLVEAIGRLLGAVALATLTFAGMLYLSFRDVSRLQFLYFAALDLVVLMAFHLSVRLSFRLRGRYRQERRTLIVGGGAQVEHLVRELKRHPWVGLHVVGYTSDLPLDEWCIPRLGTIDQTVAVVADHQIEEVIFTTQAQDQITWISVELVQQPVMLHAIPSVLGLGFARTPVQQLGNIPLISLRESALSEPQRFLKRLFDIMGSLTLLLLLSPLMLLIAIAIKSESMGPVFFLQERIGEHGQRFRMFKFRSMYQDAERRWLEVAKRDSQGRLIHKRDDDPRVTRVGQKLRRTSLDELPQLINVLRGEMSLVGPRPEMPYIALSEYEPWQWQRFRVPPGITGWWQVNGRADKIMHLHTEDDLYYIQNYSFWLDLKILWMTMSAVLRKEGAF